MKQRSTPTVITATTFAGSGYGAFGTFDDHAALSILRPDHNGFLTNFRMELLPPLSKDCFVSNSSKVGNVAVYRASPV